MLIAVLGIVFARLTLLTAQRLTKPPVESTLNYLEQGLEKNLPIVKSTKSQWGAGWIPQDCKTIVQDEGHQASDIQIFSVTYDDVLAPASLVFSVLAPCCKSALS